MVDIDNNKLIVLLIISLVVCYWAKNIYKRKEKAKNMGAILDKEDR